MFIRFIAHQLDENSGRRQGIFHSVSDLEHARALLPHEQQTYDELYKWFVKNLKTPETFARSSKPHAKKVALSWFKDSAKEHIGKMHAICAILEAHEVRTEVLQTMRPGYVVYEDDFQIAAEPFQDTPT